MRFVKYLKLRELKVVTCLKVFVFVFLAYTCMCLQAIEHLYWFHAVLSLAFHWLEVLSLECLGLSAQMI